MKIKCLKLLIVIILISSCSQKENNITKIIKEKIPSNWIITAQSDKILIKKNKTIYCYNPISLPDEPLRSQMIEKSKYKIELIITMEFDKLVNDEEYIKIYNKNSYYTNEIDDYQKKMRTFQEKDGFIPKTNPDRKIYNEYIKLIKSINIVRLPNLKFDNRSIYLTISTPIGVFWTFYNLKDYFECKAILAEIFSIFDSYGPYNVINDYDIIDKIIYHRSSYEKYLYLKNKHIKNY